MVTSYNFQLSPGQSEHRGDPPGPDCSQPSQPSPHITESHLHQRWPLRGDNEVIHVNQQGRVLEWSRGQPAEQR